MAHDDAERLERLRRAKLTGRIPPDLFAWLMGLAEAEAPEAAPAEPERLADAVADQVAHWLHVRSVSARSLRVPRRTIARALAGENLTLTTIAEIAAALDCDVEIAFQDRGAQKTPPAPQMSPPRAGERS